MNDFGIPFQRAVVRLAMVDPTFAHRACKHVTPGFFGIEPLGWLWSGIRQYFAEFQSPPTDTVVVEWLRQISPDKLPSYIAEFQQVRALGQVAEHAWVKQELREFLRRKVFETAHIEAAALWQERKTVEAYDLMSRAGDEIRALDFEAVDRQWFFDELEERQSRRIRDSLAGGISFTTGIRDLDRRTDGGVQPGEVWAVLAAAKRCKTTWLLNQVFGATRVHRQPVLVMNLEGKGSMLADKLDACFSTELYSTVKRGSMSASLLRSLHAEYMTLSRLLVIRTRNEWDSNILDIQAEVVELRAHGFRPKMLVVDYMDLGRSRHSADGETQHQIDFARDLKRFAVNEDLAVWSAWQAQRPKAGANQTEHVITSANVADAYAKVRIVDAWGSLNATDDEMKRNEMRVFWEGHRGAEVGELYWITNDLARMRMITASGVGKDPSKAGST